MACLKHLPRRPWLAPPFSPLPRSAIGPPRGGFAAPLTAALCLARLWGVPTRASGGRARGPPPRPPARRGAPTLPLGPRFAGGAEHWPPRRRWGARPPNPPPASARPLGCRLRGLASAVGAPLLGRIRLAAPRRAGFGPRSVRHTPAPPALGGRRVGGHPPFGTPLQEAHRGGPLAPPSFHPRGAATAPRGAK